MTDMKPFHVHYRRLLTALLIEGVTEINRRTTQPVLTLPGGVGFRVDLGNEQVPVPGNRKVYPSTAAAEIAWFLQGTKSVAWLQNHVPMWNKFTEDDGRTIENAYGYRWRRHFGRDQINKAITTLLDDQSSRQVVICAWDPSTDGLGEKSKNFPCPTHFTLNVVDQVLHSALFLRSSDVFVGLPYDVMGHAFLMDMFAVELGLAIGVLHITLAHAHLYQIHYDMAVTSIETDGPGEYMTLPGRSLKYVMESPDMYVQEIKNQQVTVEWPDYNPKPEVIG